MIKNFCHVVKPLIHSSQKPTRALAVSAFFQILRLDESSRGDLASWLLRRVEKNLNQQAKKNLFMC